MKIIVSGLLAYDTILDYPGLFSSQILPEKIHSLSVSFVTENISENFGGCAGNIAYGLALLGESPVLASAVGRDFGPYKNHLEKLGAGIEYVRTIEDKKTSTVYLMADKGGNQIAGVYLGTMAYESLIKQEDVVSESFAIISPGNVSDMQRLPGMYRSSKVPFIFDPGQEIPLLSSEDLKNGISGSRALISNDYELSLIIKKTGWTQEDILSNTEILITTLGESGSRIQTKSAVYQIPAIKIEKFVDATGAGDAYRAGLIKGMLLGWPIDVCGEFASVVAGYAVEVYGPQGYSVDFKKVSERYKKEFQKNLPGL